MKLEQLKTQFETLGEHDKRAVKKMKVALERGYRDPVFFANYFLGIPLHEGQKQYLRNSDPIYTPDQTRKYILVPCNRWGKTMALSTKHIRFAFYKLLVPREEMTVTAIDKVRYKTLDLSPHSNQVRACYNYIFDILHNRFVIVRNGKRSTNKCKIGAFFKGKNEAQLRIDFGNNATFHGASTGEDQAASLAGAQFGFISYDECVFSHHLREELPARIMSRTVDLNAPIDLISTFDREAHSQQYYYSLVKKGLAGRNEWQVQTGKYSDNIFIPEQIMDASRKKIRGEDYDMYRQVFLGEAIPSSIKLFETQIVDNMFRHNLHREEPKVEHEYLISVDWGGSEQGDPTIMLVIDKTTSNYRVVHHEEVKGGSPHVKFALLQTLQIHFNNAKIIMDTNSLGGVIIKKILNEMKVKTYDFDAHGGEKGEALTCLSLVLTYNRRYHIDKDGALVEEIEDYGKLRSYIIGEMEDQLGMYQLDDKKLKQDYVVVLYQAAWFLEKKYRQKEKTTHLIQRHTGNKPYATTRSNPL